MNLGFNKKIFNYNLNMQHTHTDGYDLSPQTATGPGQYFSPNKKTLEQNESMIFNHSLSLALSVLGFDKDNKV